MEKDAAFYRMIKRYASFLYDIRGDFYGFVRVCSFLFVIFMSFEEIFSFLYDHTAQGKKSDQVREAIRALKISAMFHTAATVIYGPMNTQMMYSQRYVVTAALFLLNRYSRHLSP